MDFHELFSLKRYALEEDYFRSIKSLDQGISFNLYQDHPIFDGFDSKKKENRQKFPINFFFLAFQNVTNISPASFNTMQESSTIFNKSIYYSSNDEFNMKIVNLKNLDSVFDSVISFGKPAYPIILDFDKSKEFLLTISTNKRSVESHNLFLEKLTLSKNEVSSLESIARNFFINFDTKDSYNYKKRLKLMKVKKFSNLGSNLNVLDLKTLEAFHLFLKLVLKSFHLSNREVIKRSVKLDKELLNYLDTVNNQTLPLGGDYE